MNAAEETLRRAIVDLNACGAHWALVGGFAVSSRAEPRLTRDVDAAVEAADDAAAEALVAQLTARGWAVTTLVEQDAVGRLATVRLLPAAHSPAGAVLDVLFASSGIEPEIARDAEPLELIAGLVAPVARVGHLVALKLLARDDLLRPQDTTDLRSLRGALDGAERDRARTGVALIEERGFARGRDLTRALDEWLASQPSAS